MSFINNHLKVLTDMTVMAVTNEWRSVVLLRNVVKILRMERTPHGGYYSFTLCGAGLGSPKAGVLMRTCIGGNTIREVCPGVTGQENLLNCRLSPFNS